MVRIWLATDSCWIQRRERSAKQWRADRLLAQSHARPDAVVGPALGLSVDGFHGLVAAACCHARPKCTSTAAAGRRLADSGAQLGRVSLCVCLFPVLGRLAAGLTGGPPAERA